MSLLLLFSGIAVPVEVEDPDDITENDINVSLSCIAVGHQIIGFILENDAVVGVLFGGNIDQGLVSSGGPQNGFIGENL